ncbi:uncharacterized protein LOC34619868 [Cyclospora cayetanensis]|uniref:Uncharacterized protein LOC34619868 n=1 Tax=Cyclospora cayetanensis TaxID=88456 RepID=A0A6P6RW62_9EIME|nr:uncharacterized protein LOC34619868 [Cyclospora cayetanensis]
MCGLEPEMRRLSASHFNTLRLRAQCEIDAHLLCELLLYAELSAIAAAAAPIAGGSSVSKSANPVASLLQQRHLIRALCALPPHQISLSLQELSRQQRRPSASFWIAAAEALLGHNAAADSSNSLPLLKLHLEDCSTIANAFASASQPHDALFAALNGRFAAAANAAATADSSTRHSSSYNESTAATASATAGLNSRNVSVYLNALGNLRMRKAASELLDILDSRGTTNSSSLWPALISGCSGCDLSMVFSALAKLQLIDLPLLQHMLMRLQQQLQQQLQKEQKQQQLHVLDGRSAANIWASLGQVQSFLQQQRYQLLHQLLPQLSAVLRLHMLSGQMTAMEVSIVANSLPKLAFWLQRDTEQKLLLHAIAWHVRTFGSTYTSQGLTLVLHAFVKLQHPAPLLFAATAPLLLRLLPRFKPQCFAAASLAYSSNCCCLPQQQVQQLLLRICGELEARAAAAAASPAAAATRTSPAASAGAGAAPLPAFAAQQICGILGAMAHAGCCSPGAFDVLCRQLLILHQQGLLAPRDIAEAAAAMGALKRLHAPLLRLLVAAAVADAARFGPPDIVKVLGAVSSFASDTNSSCPPAALAANSIWQREGAALVKAIAAGATAFSAPDGQVASEICAYSRVSRTTAAAAAGWDAESACRLLQGCYKLQIAEPRLTDWAWQTAFFSRSTPSLAAAAAALSAAASAAADAELTAASAAAVGAAAVNSAAVTHASIAAAALVRLGAHTRHSDAFLTLLSTRVYLLLQQQRVLQLARVQQQQHRTGMQSLALLFLSWGAARLHNPRLLDGRNAAQGCTAPAAEGQFLSALDYLLSQQQQPGEWQDRQATARQLLVGIACCWHAYTSTWPPAVGAAAGAAPIPLQLLKVLSQTVQLADSLRCPSTLPQAQHQQLSRLHYGVCDTSALDEGTSELHIEVAAALTQLQQRQQQHCYKPKWQMLTEQEAGVYRIDLLLSPVKNN